MILPGATIGILGGGQLGRMLAMAAAQLGYRAHVYAPEASGPATEVTAHWTQGRFEDADAMRAFAATVDVATYEFESIDPQAVAFLSGRVAVHPPVAALDTARYRPAEKALVVALGGRTAPYRELASVDDLVAALDAIGAPAILKTTLFGYDGKGQVRIDSAADARGAWDQLGRPPALPHGVPAILEGRVDFACEFSVLLARGRDGAIAVWDTPENVHVDGILATSTVPGSGIVAEQAVEAIGVARAIAERLDYVGVMAAEFFATADGPVFNEMAPRVHNSGHWTIEGAETSQFENHIRAICGLPLGSTALTGTRVTMENLVGHAPYASALAEPGAHVHLYGKSDAREGRKMGHVTRVWR